MAVTTTLLSDVDVSIADSYKGPPVGELLGISQGLPWIFNSKENKIFFLIHFILVLDCVGIECKTIVEILIHLIF